MSLGRGSRHPEVSQPLRRQELRRILSRSDEHPCEPHLLPINSTITSSKIPGSSYTVIGNPGNPFIFPLTADQSHVHGRSARHLRGPEYRAKSGRSWLQRLPTRTVLHSGSRIFPATGIANIIYDTPDSDSLLSMTVSKAAGAERGLDLRHRRHRRQSLQRPSLVLGPGGRHASHSHPGTVEPGRGDRLRDRR